MVVFILVLLLIGFLFGNLVIFLFLFVWEIDLVIYVGVFYSVVAIVSFVFCFFFGFLVDIYGWGLFIVGSLICYLLFMVCFV